MQRDTTTWNGERREETERNVRLGGGTDTRHGETDVDGGANTTEEELSLQEDLTVGNRNDLKGEE